MAELRELERKLESIRALGDIVNAMRNMAAIYVRRAEATIEASRGYADVVYSALHLALRLTDGLRPETAEDVPSLAIVFAGDQGLCGSYNDRVVAAAWRYRDECTGPVDIISIGYRGRELLRLRGVEPVLCARAPSSLEGIKSQLPDLAAHIFRTYVERGARRMTFIYNEYESMGRFSETVRRVLPPAADQLAATAQGRPAYDPILTAPAAQVLGRFVEEYFYIELYRALLESHASENGARLASMTAAATSIEDRTAQLLKEYQSVRQDVITAEILEVVGGAEALRHEQ